MNVHSLPNGLRVASPWLRWYWWWSWCICWTSVVAATTPTTTSAANSFSTFESRSGYTAPCDQVHELTASVNSDSGGSGSSTGRTTKVITIDSPNYPYTQYPPRSSCRHLIRAPPEYAITVQCHMNLPATATDSTAATAPDVVYANSRNCQTDFLYISAPATNVTNDGYFEYFCGRGYVSRTSVFNDLTLAYASTSDTAAGYFSCSAFATLQSCNCGWNPVTRQPGSGRIIGGEEATSNEYAAMVALVDTRTARVFCGGSISE